jgi:arsenate reductase-like glutaredoxin family protein
MKHWIEKNYKTLIITAFLVPIITVAIVSISHVTKWYGISNPVSWALYLSIGIEIAALSALAAISANMGNKVYFPFAVVTIVQFIGNIYFAYSYIDIDGQPFKDWVGLVSPFVEFMGVDPNDFVGHKRFLAFFAGGMLPIISLSFLHMLVKFTEEDRLKETVTKENDTPTPTIPSEDIVGEVSRIRLSEEDLAILEKHLLSPEPPNEKLKSAAEKYSNAVHAAAEKYSNTVRERHTHIDDFKVKQEALLVEMMKNDQELGLYDEPFDNPLIKEDEEESVSDWDVTLMDGLEDEEPFFTEEETENILQEEPTEQEIQENFSTIEPETENIFQDNTTEPLIPEEVISNLLNELIEDTNNQELRTEFVPSLSDEEIMEMNQDEYERKFDTEEFDEYVPEPFATPEEVEKYQIDQDIEDVVNTPVVDQDNFGDNFDIISSPPVIEKINIEESKPEVIVMDTDFETDDVDNDFWRQHVIPDDEDLKKNS